MNQKELNGVKDTINSGQSAVRVQSIVNEGEGRVAMYVQVRDYKELAHLTGDKGPSPLIPRTPAKTSASVIYKDALQRGALDLMKPDIMQAKPHDLFKRAYEYYFTQDIYGSVVDTLTNFAAKGFENDIDDADVKQFYDNWAADIGFDAILDQIFLDFFRIGFVRTYKVLGPYIPKTNRTSSLPGRRLGGLRGLVKAFGAKKSKQARIPLGYTVLNPMQIEIEGPLMFGLAKVTLKPTSELIDLFKKDRSDLTEAEKMLIKLLPDEFKTAAGSNKTIVLDSNLVGAVDYRKMFYERYPKPRGTRAFESVEYKNALRQADYSTLDGITNAVLKVTVGNDQFPITDPKQLEEVAQLFNTSAKSYNIIWNHTLKMEYISPQQIEGILGQDKYRQVNEDITGAFNVLRALIDGVGSYNSKAVDLAVKAVIEEINYARRQVTRWIYGEYRQVAEAMSFDRFPKIRWDDTALRDELMMMNVVQGLIDRRILSYRTGIQKLGYDFDTVLSELLEEKNLVLDGTLGIIGSPYNPKAAPPISQPQVQPKQRTPKGTPSEGRPKGRVARPKMPDGFGSKKGKSAALKEFIASLDLDELGELHRMIGIAEYTRKKNSAGGE